MADNNDLDPTDDDILCTTTLLNPAFALDQQVNSVIASVFFDAMFYGLFLLSFLVGLFTVFQRQKNRRTRQTRLMLAAMIILCFLATISTSISLARRAISLTARVNPNLCQPLANIFPPSKLLIGMRVATGQLMMWIGDLIILWRSWSLTQESKLLRTLTLTCQLTAFDVLVIRIFIVSISPIGASILSVVFLTLLLITNALATFALVKKSYRTTRGLNMYAGERSFSIYSDSLSSGVLTILVECGVLYAIVQMVIVWFAILEVIIPERWGVNGRWQSSVLVASSTVMVCGELVSGILSCLTLGLVAIKAGGHSRGNSTEVVSTLVFNPKPEAKPETDTITSVSTDIV